MTAAHGKANSEKKNPPAGMFYASTEPWLIGDTLSADEGGCGSRWSPDGKLIYYRLAEKSWWWK